MHGLREARREDGRCRTGPRTQLRQGCRCRVELVREALGRAIDLGPASCEKANETVLAVRYFTEVQGRLVGLLCNPSYGRVSWRSSLDV